MVAGHRPLGAAATGENGATSRAFRAAFTQWKRTARSACVTVTGPCGPDYRFFRRQGACMSTTTLSPAPVAAGRRSAVNPWLVLVIACLAQFMVVLDATVVNIELPSVQRGLHFS